MRWQVREATGGAEAMARLEEQGAEAMVLDSRLPDLEVGEFATEMSTRHPEMDLLRMDGIASEAGARSPRRNELLHALRKARENDFVPGCDDAGWTLTPLAMTVPRASAASATERVIAEYRHVGTPRQIPALVRPRTATQPETDWCTGGEVLVSLPTPRLQVLKPEAPERSASGAKYIGAALAETHCSMQISIFDNQRLEQRPRVMPLPDMVGESPAMMELSRMIRLVAPRTTTVLIEGETGTGKELVAHAVHRLSPRAQKPFVVLNCAAIPESLLEAELFGHTRGAFTGAVQSRTGRIESAHGGTLFLDEIGEMPLGLQAKMLRFLESSELQRVGDNNTVHVDVRVVAATHEPLQQRAKEHAFRLDLYHRLAVFPVFIPALRQRMEDVLPLAEYLLNKLGQEMPVKRLSMEAARKLMEHDWPGNVRCLAHVLERAIILAEDRPEIAHDEIRF